MTKAALLPRWPWPADDPRRFRRHLTARDFPQPRPRSCRWCWRDVPAGRRTYCCAECEHEVSLRTNPSYLAEQVLKRDKGVCALCGKDTERGRRLVRAWRDRANRRFRAWSAETYQFAARVDGALGTIIRRHFGHACLGFPEQPWQADHTIPISEGGGGCGLDNMRTLCLSCHGKETGALRRRLNARRRPQQELSFPLPVEETSPNA